MSKIKRRPLISFWKYKIPKINVKKIEFVLLFNPLDISEHNYLAACNPPECPCPPASPPYTCVSQCCL